MANARDTSSADALIICPHGVPFASGVRPDRDVITVGQFGPLTGLVPTMPACFDQASPIWQHAGHRGPEEATR